MNADRRKELTRAIELLMEAQAIIVAAAEEEREYYDNMPESLQNGEKGDRASEAADRLENADSTIGDAISDIEGASE